MFNKQSIHYNTYLIVVGVLASLFSITFILYSLRMTELSLTIQRAIAWLPVIAIFVIVDKCMHKPADFITMNPYIEYGGFFVLSLLFIVMPLIEQRMPWMEPLLSLVWLIPLGYLYYHKRNRFE